MKFAVNKLNQNSKSLLSICAGLVLVMSALLPVIFSRDANAAQLTLRSLTLSSGVPGATSQTYTYGFTMATAGQDVNSIKLEACTAAVGACGAPTGLDIDAGSQASQSGWENTNAFARNATGDASCVPANNLLCLDRTDGVTENADAKTLAWNTQTNPTTANSTFFVRITLYSDTTWDTTVDSGTVAAAVVQTLTIDAAVAEVLNFCVGATTVDDATSDVTAGADDCSGVGGTDVNIGTLDTSAINVSPISTNGGDNENGVAVIRSNAVNGSSVYYKAVQDLTATDDHRGALRIIGATCSDDTDGTAVFTDQCINSGGYNETTGNATQTAFSAGTENFGMSICALNSSLNPGTAYSCVFSTGTYNLVRNGDYDCTGNNTFSSTCSQGYAWDSDGASATIIATSTGSSTKVIDDEAMLLKFAATPSITTPFGAYEANADFIAVSTY